MLRAIISCSTCRALTTTTVTYQWARIVTLILLLLFGQAITALLVTLSLLLYKYPEAAFSHPTVLPVPCSNTNIVTAVGRLHNR